jgi:hypothetical protein
MKYESHGAWHNAERRAAYHCGYDGCTVRYDATDGYHTVLQLDDNDYRLEEPGVNTLKCPQHHSWLYRQKNLDTEPGVCWRCGIEGCSYRFDAPTKGDWVRT